MDTLSKKSLQTSRGFTYTYYVSKALAQKPTVLLLHGWPDSAKLWEDLATNHLIPAGYGTIIPDCLGFDGSDKPTNPRDYNILGLTNDYSEILDTEKVDRVICTGHDIGAFVTSRFYVFRPERCLGMITLNIPHQPKSQGRFDLDAMSPLMKKALGYFPFEYFHLYSDPINGPALLGNHIESLFTALHPKDPFFRLQVNCAPDGIKNWLEQDKKGPVQAYATEKMRQDFIARMSRDGFVAPLCYYRAAVEGIQYEPEKDMPAERYIVNVPYLAITATEDVVCVPQMIDQPKAMGLLPHLTEEKLDVGHWSMHAAPKEVGEICVKWLNENF